MKVNRSHCRAGFTLIEMLVVVAVILILSGILLRTTVLVIRNTGKARAAYEMEQIQNVLSEYMAEYGTYPPVYQYGPATNVEYELEGPSTRTNTAFRLFLQNPLYNNPNDAARFFPDTPRSGYATTQSLGYRYGLVSFIYPRFSAGDHGDRPHWFDKDTARDEAAKARWAHFLKDLKVERTSAGRVVNLESRIPYTNAVMTLLDPWRSNYRYESRPPFLSYRLWSAGPDGQDGTFDDINGNSALR